MDNETLTTVSYYLHGIIPSKSDSNVISAVKKYDQSIWSLRCLYFNLLNSLLLLNF